ncbi:MAG: hydroxymethylbilane synthase [Chloroflexota bacterium]|nr:hydroxymethylbilane synthase [Chloroflexota bacterium]
MTRAAPPVLRVATRGTPLARAQTDLVVAALQRVHPQMHCEPVVVRTTGDADPTRPIAALGERGVFTKALQDALLDGRADVAVHSFKDLPTESVPGLTIAAVPTRGDPREALVAGPVRSLADLAPGATLGTGSPRRVAQALRQRPDLNIVPLRGSVGSRVAAQQEGRMHATIMAVAGLQRAGLDAAISAVLELPDFLPAPAQAALAVEAQADRRDVVALIATIEDPAARAATTAERAFLHDLQGGCSLPAAALATVNGDELVLDTAVYVDDGGAVRTHRQGPVDEAAALGREAAAETVARGVT